MEGRKAPWVVRSEDSCERALEMSSHNTFSHLFKRNEDNSLFVCVAYTSHSKEFKRSQKQRGSSLLGKSSISHNKLEAETERKQGGVNHNITKP